MLFRSVFTRGLVVRLGVGVDLLGVFRGDGVTTIRERAVVGRLETCVVVRGVGLTVAPGDFFRTVMTTSRSLSVLTSMHVVPLHSSASAWKIG